MTNDRIAQNFAVVSSLALVRRRLVIGAKISNMRVMCAARAKRSSELVNEVQRVGPFGRMSRREIYSLRPEQIHPVIRIAHRQKAGLVIPERIILDYELVLIVKGKGRWKIEGVERDYSAHDLLLVPPFEPHSFLAAGPDSEHLAIHFDYADGTPRIEAALAERTPYRVRFTHRLAVPRQQNLFEGHRWIGALTKVVSEHGAAGDLESARASVRLAGILLELLEEKRDDRTSPGSGNLRQQDRVHQVVKHMEGNLARAMNHRTFEEVSKLSASRLQALFREVTGYSPLDYLRRLRVEEARRLLADQRLSVKEIAALTGFRDTSHLSKVFRRIDGLSPAHYRAAILAGRQEKSATAKR